MVGGDKPGKGPPPIEESDVKFEVPENVRIIVFKHAHVASHVLLFLLLVVTVLSLLATCGLLAMMTEVAIAAIILVPSLFFYVAVLIAIYKNSVKLLNVTSILSIVFAFLFTLCAVAVQAGGLVLLACQMIFKIKGHDVRTIVYYCMGFGILIGIVTFVHVMLMFVLFDLKTKKKKALSAEKSAVSSLQSDGSSLMQAAVPTEVVPNEGIIGSDQSDTATVNDGRAGSSTISGLRDRTKDSSTTTNGQDTTESTLQGHTKRTSTASRGHDYTEEGQTTGTETGTTVTLQPKLNFDKVYGNDPGGTGY